MSQPTPMTVYTNSFAITQLPSRSYYMYDIMFSPPVKEGPKRKQLFHHLQNTVKPAMFNPRLVYDGNAIAFSPGRANLGGGSGATFCIMLGKNEEQNPRSRGAIQIRITLTSSDAIRPADVSDITERRTITQRSLTATNVMQLIVRQGPNQNHTNNGRAYFMGNDRKVLNGSGIELWGGIYQSVRPTLGRMILTIDTSTAAVYQSGKLIDVMMDFLGARNVNELQLTENHPNYKKLDKFLMKLRIKVLSGPGGKHSRIKSIRGIVPAGGNYTFYKESEGEEITVAQHFHRAYELRVQYPRIIGISLSGRKDSGADIVPAEFCTVERGQLYRHKIPESVTPAMVKFATQKPPERLNKIVQGASNYNRSEYVVESEMRVDTSPMEIRAMILAEQRIMYGNRVTMNVNNGAWNVVRKQLYVAATIESWAMVNFCGDKIRTPSCEKFMNDLWKCCGELGMRVAPPHGVYNAVGHNVPDQLDGVMQQIFRQIGNAELVAKVNLIVVLPQNAAPIRNEVKRWGDITHGIATFCIRELKVVGANNQYHNNVALKLNARNGGINCRGVSQAMDMLKSEPFIIMGADVGHPGPGVQKPSVTSLVYSHDNNATQYVALSGVQTPRTEIIADLQDYVYNAIDSWGGKNQTAPMRIFFFRDGVSEGEFARVAQDEIKQIKTAIDAVWADRNIKAKKPLLTFIVVGKRHHAVFFPKDERHSDKTGNCRAGSVFGGDDITHPALEDFYLQSHSAIIGTVRSSHYIILLNENKDRFPLPAIQELAYTLCHNYAKATRSVSIPTPVYYADLVCSRGPFHVDPNATLNFDEGMSASSGQTTFDLDSWKSAYRPINTRLEKTMYFL